MTEKTKKSDLERAGTFTVGRVGNSLKVTIPTSAHIREGEQLTLYLEANGTLVYRPKKRHVSIWDTDFVNHYDFDADKKAIGTSDDVKHVGKELD
ncbi:hypothetical protein PQ472_00900 [Lacticaseibacillus pabuli]|uniref:AbrB family transcriptional regulator n=1 Tax=Lacticaseibacillus pabuli TaxID=3025672 RepID=A0ABY7WRL8_9LACO|nr:hypothetical protein [Lacticaseibacillus sp. KACC 23028]WDF82830.1 hypothetical protein PQ472_00900 [Lacticaseibacillus sp. KACC 23028]